MIAAPSSERFSGSHALRMQGQLVQPTRAKDQIVTKTLAPLKMIATTREGATKVIAKTFPENLLQRAGHVEVSLELSGSCQSLCSKNNRLERLQCFLIYSSLC